MRDSEKIFEDVFNKELKPTLSELNFSRYSLPKGWIQPSFLFKHNTNNIWFGCSWDWRDFYFDAELGGLYGFKDVLPRVIICGFVFEKKSKTKLISEYLNEQMINTKNNIEDLANLNFEKYYKFIDDTQSKKINNLKMYIQKEIMTEKELPFFH